jgi:2,3-bisphosphoglycerate-independent phosphoglycerate mutase
MDGRKYLIIIGDGMAGLPLEELGGKTTLEYADTPNMDRIARTGIFGLASTVPPGMNPGSDTANLSIFGYDPAVYFTGRAPLEAVSMGIKMDPDDAAFRCNFSLIEDGFMKSFSAEHIDSKFSAIIINELANNIKTPGIEFYPGVSYRNIMIWRNYPYKKITDTTPPHDITGRNISSYLPSGEGSEILNDIMSRSAEIISTSLKIREARGRYKGSPSQAWLWGGGKRPMIKTLKEKFGLTGYTISAVDLIHGIGISAGLTPAIVEGATGYIDTNYEGKAGKALELLEKSDFVFLHVESPDESGHEGNVSHKLQSIEDFDKKVVGNILNGMSRFEKYSILVMPDHPTPISLKTHSSDPVPFCIFENDGRIKSEKGKGANSYSEKEASATGLYIPGAHKIIEYMTSGKIF